MCGPSGIRIDAVPVHFEDVGEDLLPAGHRTHDVHDGFHPTADFFFRRVPWGGGVELDLKPGDQHRGPQATVIGFGELPAQGIQDRFLRTDDGPGAGGDGGEEPVIAHLQGEAQCFQFLQFVFRRTDMLGQYADTTAASGTRMRR